VKEIRAVLKLKNNRLIKAREQLGLTAAALSEKIGVDKNSISKLENLRLGPIDGFGRIRSCVQKLADFHGYSVEYLFPDSIGALQARSVTREFSVAEAMRLSQRTPEQELEVKEAKQLLEWAVSETSVAGRGRKLIESFLDGETREVSGSKLGVSGTRAGQLEARTLAEARHKLWAITGHDHTEMPEEFTPLIS
jgi:transcriptional regulator with XRE-family HTH domain